MAVTENKLITRQDGCKTNYPVAASTRLYQGTLTFLTPAGYLDDDTGTGSNRFAGINIAETDNSSGSAADKYADVWNEGIFPLTGTGFVQADVGKDVYASDNYTISTAYAAGSVRIGVCREYISTTKLGVEIETDSPPGMVYTGVAASAAISNTTTQTAFDKSFSFPASSLRAGDVIRVVAQGIATSTNSTDTLTPTLRIAGTDAIVGPAVDVANNDVFVIQADIVIRTIGASGTFVAAGIVGLGATATGTGRVAYKASTTIDTTAAVAIDVTATWSVASASNSVRLDVLDVQLLRRS